MVNTNVNSCVCCCDKASKQPLRSYFPENSQCYGKEVNGEVNNLRVVMSLWRGRVEYEKERLREPQREKLSSARAAALTRMWR